MYGMFAKQFLMILLASIQGCFKKILYLLCRFFSINFNMVFHGEAIAPRNVASPTKFNVLCTSRTRSPMMPLHDVSLASFTGFANQI
jgi:hypothetical protein